MKETKLLPCPFCGKPPKRWKAHAHYGIECRNPNCGVSANAWGRTEPAAARRWNRRKP